MLTRLIGKLWPLAAVAALTVAEPPVKADTAYVMPTKDNTLYSEAHAESNGAGYNMFAGRTRSGDIRRAVIAFDIAEDIPQGSTITNARLHLSLSRAGVNAGRTVSLYRLLNDWGESISAASGRDEGGGAPATTNDATWVQRFFPQTPWRRAGGDFADVASAEFGIGPLGRYVWTTPRMIADVQRWLDLPATDFGWILIGDESVRSSSVRFDTREHRRKENRPMLEIEFMPPAEADLPVAAATGSPG
jgi:hypothetical protein